MYVVDLAGKLADPAEPFRSVTVFKYYGSGLTEGIDPAAFIGVTRMRRGAGIRGQLGSSSGATCWRSISSSPQRPFGSRRMAGARSGPMLA